MRTVLRRAAVSAALVVLAAAAVQIAAGGDTASSKTPAMIKPVASGVTVKALISVGDTVGSYTFESIPDGTSLLRGSRRRTTVFVNHETSLVPFPFDAATGVGQSDFTNALLSRLVLDRNGRVLSGDYVIPSSANFQRFCSNFLAGPREHFNRRLVLTNEEATDVVNRTGTAWPPTAANGSNPEQAGLVVAYDVRAGRYRAIRGMGRHNHENSVAIPGYRRAVVLSGDDTFAAPSSQLYMYLAKNATAVWNDRGALYAFKSDDPSVNDYGDLAAGASVSGRFIAVPRDVALGDQNALETWSNANGVFQFIRLEDIAYDRNRSNVVYLADTGEPRAVPGPGPARMTRGPSSFAGPFPNGRIFRLELARNDPTVVRSLSVLIDADAGGARNPSMIHNPDNLETTARSLLIQEDPGSQNQFAASDAGASGARIWRYNLRTRSLQVVAEVDQSLDPGARLGTWESSGIVDASSAFGKGAFLVTVQAHTVLVNREQRGPLLFKREGGQLLLVRIRGA